MKKFRILLLILIVPFMLTGCFDKKEKKEANDNSLKYEITSETYGTSEKHGYYVSADKLTYTVCMGMRSTGGYEIKIINVDVDNNDNVIVSLKEISPEPDAMVTQALTYPSTTITFNKEPKSIIFMNEDGTSYREIGE